MKFLVLLLPLVLAGCAGLQPALEAGVRKAEAVNDKILLTAEAVICAKHLPLRAYEDRYGARWATLVAFCQWGMTLPAPVNPDL